LEKLEPQIEGGDFISMHHGENEGRITRVRIANLSVNERTPLNRCPPYFPTDIIRTRLDVPLEFSHAFSEVAAEFLDHFLICRLYAARLCGARLCSRCRTRQDRYDP
jgi:hypothetical protein